MEKSIVNFEIVIDYSDVEHVYDYGQQKWIHRPETGYRHKDMLAKAPLDYDKDTRHAKLQVMMMDKVFHDKRPFNQKNFTQHTLKNQEDKPTAKQLEILNRCLPFYNPGDLIKGHIHLENTEPISASSIVIKASGKTFVKVWVPLSVAPYRAKGVDTQMTEYLTLWHNTKSKPKTSGDHVVCVDDEVLPVSDSIPPGSHDIPFQFVIPGDAKASCPPLVVDAMNYYETYIGYRLKASLNVEGMTKNVVSRHGLWVEDHNTEEAHKEPVHFEKTLKGGILGKSGNIKCTIDCQSVLSTGKTYLPITLNIDNQTTTDVTEVRARIVLSGVGYSSKKTTKWFQQDFSHKGKKALYRDKSIPAGTADCCQLNVPLDFSKCSVDTNLIPESNAMEDTILITINYELVVELKRGGIHRNLEVKVPITLTKDTNDRRMSKLYDNLNK